MVAHILFAVLGLLYVVIAVSTPNDACDPAADLRRSNASLVDDFVGPPALDSPALPGVLLVGYTPDQWRMPEVFKRQAVCSNYCGPTQSAPRTYCGCGQACCAGNTKTVCCVTASGMGCCAGGFCCSTAVGAACCGSSCCINGATCNGNQQCGFKTVVVSTVATVTSVGAYRDITSFVTNIDGTAAITSTISSVTIVTISSADVATSIATATVTGAAAKRARDIEAIRPADVPQQPQETYASSTIPKKLNGGKLDRHIEQDLLAPQITPIPGYAHQHGAHYLEKRQTFFTSTLTSVISTYTVSITSTRLFTSTISARATATVFTTSWQTVTSVVNAKKTVTSTTTLTLTPSAAVSQGVSRSDASTTSSASAGPADPNNVNANSTPGSTTGVSGLSKGAQAGIGAGTGAGSLIICLILAFWFRRRRKSRKERNQVMIDGAVSSAIAAQQQQHIQQQQQQVPASYHDHNKHLSTTTYSTASPNGYSPSPPLHAPQPGYVYPPPPGHQLQQPAYNTNPMAFPEALGPRELHSPHSSTIPPYGSEMDGSSTRRHELPLYGSPQPVHPGPYPNIPHPGHYSDLPEVRR